MVSASRAAEDDNVVSIETGKVIENGAPSSVFLTANRSGCDVNGGIIINSGAYAVVAIMA